MVCQSPRLRSGVDEGTGVGVGAGGLCVSQVAVAVLGLVIAIGFEGEEPPEASLQPAKMY